MLPEATAPAMIRNPLFFTRNQANMCALPSYDLTPEEYLEMERRAGTKSEYLHGEVFSMAGASSRAHHDLV